MSTTCFLRTVRPGDAAASHAEQLAAAVHNSGNLFFEGAVSRHLADAVEVGEFSDIPEGTSTLVLSMSNFISPATDLGEVADAIEASGIERVVMIGAGAQAESYDRSVEVAPGTRRFLAVLSERSASIGVRGYFTAEVLDAMGIRNVDVIGCPSMFYHCARDFQVHTRELDGRRPRTVSHFTPYGNLRDACGHLLSFAYRECEAFIAQSETFLAFSDGTEERLDYYIRYFGDGDVAPDDMRAWLRSHVRWYFDLERWIGAMGEVDFSVGGRFHGNMAVLLAGTPALNLVQDSRTRELCEYLNLPYRFLQDFDGRTTAQALYEATDFTLFNATFPAKYDAYRAFLARNGLRTTLDGHAITSGSASAKVRLASCLELIRSAEQAGFQGPQLGEELARRVASERSWAMMKLAEAGKYDVRQRSPDGATGTASAGEQVAE